MAEVAVFRELRQGMIRIGCLVILRRVAPYARVRRAGVITLMAGVAIARNRDVRTRKRVNRTMIKNRRGPSRFAMAKFTIRWKLSGSVIRISNLVVILQMTADTSVWGIRIIALVTGTAISGNCRMYAI